MAQRPRILLVGAASEHSNLVRRWLMELGAEPVTQRDGSPYVALITTDAATPHPVGAVPTLEAPRGTSRTVIEAFVRKVQGRTPGSRFDDHGSTKAWPRGSF